MNNSQNKISSKPMINSSDSYEDQRNTECFTNCGFSDDIQGKDYTNIFSPPNMADSLLIENTDSQQNSGC